jgi:hypothetical protein
MNLEQTARIQAIRQRALRGEATREELKEGIAILRGDRISAQIASTTSRTAKAAAAAPVDTGAVLAGLRALGAKLNSGPVA